MRPDPRATAPRSAPAVSAATWTQSTAQAWTRSRAATVRADLTTTPHRASPRDPRRRLSPRRHGPCRPPVGAENRVMVSDQRLRGCRPETSGAQEQPSVIASCGLPARVPDARPCVLPMSERRPPRVDLEEFRGATTDCRALRRHAPAARCRSSSCWWGARSRRRCCILAICPASPWPSAPLSRGSRRLCPCRGPWVYRPAGPPGRPGREGRSGPARGGRSTPG